MLQHIFSITFAFCSVLEAACHDSQYGVQEGSLTALRAMCAHASLIKVRFCTGNRHHMALFTAEEKVK